MSTGFFYAVENPAACAPISCCANKEFKCYGYYPTTPSPWTYKRSTSQFEYTFYIVGNGPIELILQVPTQCRWQQPGLREWRRDSDGEVVLTEEITIDYTLDTSMTDSAWTIGDGDAIYGGQSVCDGSNVEFTSSESGLVLPQEFSFRAAEGPCPEEPAPQSGGGFFYATRDPSVCEVPAETCPYDQPELRPCVGYVPTKTNANWSFKTTTQGDPTGPKDLAYQFRVSDTPIALVLSDGSQCTWRHIGTIEVRDENGEVTHEGSCNMEWKHYGAYVPAGPTIPEPIEAGTWDVNYWASIPIPFYPTLVFCRSSSAPDCDGSNVTDRPETAYMQYLGSEPRFVAKFVPSETQ